MIRLRIQDHTVMPGKQFVEIFDDERCVGAIYPHPQGIRIVSKYMSGGQIEFTPGAPSELLIKLP